MNSANLFFENFIVLGSILTDCIFDFGIDTYILFFTLSTRLTRTFDRFIPTLTSATYEAEKLPLFKIGSPLSSYGEFPLVSIIIVVSSSDSLIILFTSQHLPLNKIAS